jgi:hypothetical protein
MLLCSPACWAADVLVAGFQAPPLSARPAVWWHWMNGNVSAEGAKLDLEWMKRVGIGGVQMFQIDLGTPILVEKRLAYMSPEWQDAFRVATVTANRLGLELAIHAAPGWSASGGPWVNPKDAMKKFVWSETPFAGRGRFIGKLPAPPAISGPFQDVPLDGADDPRVVAPSFYADAAVIAYRSGPTVRSQPLRPERTLTSSSKIDQALLLDGRFGPTSPLELDSTHSAWIQYEFKTNQTVRSVQVGLPGRRGFGSPPAPIAELTASDDGEHYRLICALPATQSPVRSGTFPAVRARHYRLNLFSPAPAEELATAPGAVTLQFSPAASHVDVSEFRLFSEARVNAAEEKAGFATLPDYYAAATPANSNDAVAPNEVIDVSHQMASDGTLNWQPPRAGPWTILRMGYSLTGKQNGPAPREATGLEVDKLDAAKVREYLEQYLGGYQQALASSVPPARIQSILSDSIESGPQNWTDGMLTEFRRLRGYDAIPWLPALTGVTVGSVEDSDRFLWDFRRTIAQLLAENHYGQIAAVAHAHGLTYFAEALEDHRPQLGDDLEMRAFTDVPMGAMWLIPRGGAPRPTYIADLQGAASVAHVYGKSIVAAESLTSFGWPYASAPADLKTTVDLEFSLGVNRITIHESAHQPLLGSAPGLSLATFLGQYFNRNETWAELAGAWIDYIARSSYLLQQGQSQADVAYFYGEEAPLTSLFGDHPQRDVPSGFAFDFVGADAMLHRLSARGHGLEAGGAMPYRVLYLGGSSDKMTLPVMRKIRELLRAGAWVVGAKPSGSPTLSDDSHEFHQLATELWGSEADNSSVRTIGQGLLVPSHDLAGALQTLGLSPEWRFPTTDLLTQDLAVLHRHLSDGELYFVSNRTQRPIDTKMSLHAVGKAPEFWHADSGTIVNASYRIEGDNTLIPLNLDPEESIFIVLRRPALAAYREVPTPHYTILHELSGPWRLAFQPERGAPDSVQIPQLQSWSTFKDPGIRYFSGIGTYTQSLHAPRAWLHHRLFLDLGEAHEVARILVNDKPIGILWKHPYRIELTGALKEGRNVLTLEVANLWVNRLIGDAQPAAHRYTVTNGPTYKADAPLHASGLLGPVKVLALD